MNNRGINSENIMSILPSVLSNDSGMNKLARTAALGVDEILADLDAAGIYNRIEELPEDLLDILAEDLGIHWYDYDFKLETKRSVVAATFDVHRHMGTKGAMVAAICSIWPNSSVEEWFEYGGDPYFFRVLVEANGDGGEPIRYSKINRTVQLYKNARSWMEYDTVILRITCNVVIQTKQGAQRFHSVACGTLPRISTHGKLAQSAIEVQSKGNPSVYHTGHAGESETGTIPHSFTHGDISDGGLNVGASLGVSTYNSIPCGTPLGALM